jgi:hypothetical protein
LWGFPSGEVLLSFTAALQCKLEQDKLPLPHQDAVAVGPATIDLIFPGLLQDEKQDLQ